MSAHNALQNIAVAGEVEALPDPGNAGSIYVDRSPVTIQLVSAAAETRTLARPTVFGAILFLHMKTDGGDITLTVTGNFNETGDSTFVFSDAGQFAAFVSFYDGTNYYWRLVSHYGLGNASPTETGSLDGLTATATELNTMHSQTLATTAGAGITGGPGTVYKNSVQLSGTIYYTSILIDLTGLQSSTTDLDIIGQGVSAAHLGQITAARNGTILYGRLTCLEVPVTGVTDIDLYSATEATGIFDGGVAALTETALVTNGGAWTLNLVKHIQDLPVADQYLYLTCGAAGTVGTYTAGKFILELFGY